MRSGRRTALRQLAAWVGGSAIAGRSGIGWAYQASEPSIEQYLTDPLLQPASIMDFEPLAKAKLDPLAYDYLVGGSEDEVSLRDNRAGFDRIIIRPKALIDVHKIDLSVEVLGLRWEHPIFLCPAGGKNCFHQDGENTVARAAASAKTLHITNGGIQKLVESGKGPAWWQVTTGGDFRTPQTIRAFVKRLEDQGCGAICFTTDIMYVSHRERNIRNKFDRAWGETGIPRDAQGRVPQPRNPERAGLYPSRPTATPTWDTVRELRAMTQLPIVLKGILRAEDAKLCLEAGVSGIIVSNHGARQLDHVGGTIEALPEVVAAVEGKIPVMIDGGFRRGTDILKALALGARAVGIARPYLFGLAAFGQPGVERVITLLRTELALDMGLAGTPNIAAIERSLVRIRN
ncbi:MAG: alpha-hydroxy-acid oxidizing protein [Acidimicrobiia bacterium]|nr:alpha-hydroxy-acid oxidizing protein [Acidimicrobiia bacterium]